MRARRARAGAAGAALLILGLTAAASRSPAQEPAGPAADGPAIHAALKAQIEALNAEDPDRVMALFHPGAPGLDEVRRGLVALFRARDHHYSLERFTFVAVDGPYAYARCLQTTSLASRPDAPPRAVEQLFVFRRSGAAWKFWTSVVLSDGRG